MDGGEGSRGMDGTSVCETVRPEPSTGRKLQAGPELGLVPSIQKVRGDCVSTSNRKALGSAWGYFKGPRLRHHWSVCEGREGSCGDSPAEATRGGTFSPGCKRSVAQGGKSPHEQRPGHHGHLLCYRAAVKTEVPLTVAPVEGPDESARPHRDLLQSAWRGLPPKAAPSIFGHQIRRFS